jgi:hypothetical protein
MRRLNSANSCYHSAQKLSHEREARFYLVLTEEHKAKALEKRKLRIFGHKREDV